MKPSKPNFVFFCVDQMQAACLGCAGHPDVRTPHLDQLAQKGVRFDRAYCENPICTPSRVSMFTGLSSRQHGVLGNGRCIPHTTPTMVEALRNAGYRTHATGKFHLQPWSSPPESEVQSLRTMPYSHENGQLWDQREITSLPEGYFGFETSDFVGGHGDYVFGAYEHWLREQHPGFAVPRIKNVREAWRKPFDVPIEHPGYIGACFQLDIPAEIHYNTWIAERSADFLRTADVERPFFLWCSFPDPHHPFAACNPYNDLYDPDELTLPANWNQKVPETSGLAAIPRHMHGFRMEAFDEAGLRHNLAQTYGMITHIDDCVGKVLEELKRSGRADETHIAFLSDHGEYLGGHHLVTKGNHPFEEIMRVPMIWKAPTDRAEPAVVDGIVSLLDLAPTVLELAGVPLEKLCPEPHVRGPDLGWIGGQSLRECLLNSQPLPDRPFIATREDHWPRGHERSGMLRLRVLYRRNWKLIVTDQPAIGALFNLEKDPLELTDLWGDPAHREVRRGLMEEYRLEALRTEYHGLGRISSA
jgi:arylsulfatase A-like enzyme